MNKDQYTTEKDTEELLQSSKLPEPLHLAAMLEQTLQSPLHGKAADCLRRMYAEASAAQCTWVDLTNEERNTIWRNNVYVDNIIRATEAKLKQKNS